MAKRRRRVNRKPRKRRRKSRDIRPNPAAGGGVANGRKPHVPGDLTDKLQLMSQLMQFDIEIRPQALLDNHLNLRVKLAGSAPFELATVFGAMLLDTRLQSNCIRIESLVHLAVAVGAGTGLCSQAQLADCFNMLDDGICGRLEDPAEDVFVSLVTSSKGNFRVLEGIWESGAFYLQRIIDLIESMPNKEPFATLRRSVFALLTLSEAVCDRASLTRYCLGEGTPRSTITPKFCVKANRGLLVFDKSDLEALGLSVSDLKLFTFRNELIPYVLSESLTDSPLQRYPILLERDKMGLVLPTAVSQAIKLTAIEILFNSGFHKSFQRNLSIQYSKLFYESRLLGSFHGTPLKFSDHGPIPIAETMIEADKGRYLHFLFFTDTYDDLADGATEFDQISEQRVNFFEDRILKAIESAESRPNFRNGVTLLAYCGIGRGVVAVAPNTGHADWAVQFLSAPSLYTLSNTNKFNALEIWRTLDGVKRLKDLRVKISNQNGLLNLIAWINSNEGHLICHSQVPKSFRAGHGHLTIGSNFVRDLRHSVAVENDSHIVSTIDNRKVRVQRVIESVFPEDNEIPIYADRQYSKEDGTPLLFKSDKRSWWCHVLPTDNWKYDCDRWTLLKKWLPKIVPVVEPMFDNMLSDAILLKIQFEGRVVDYLDDPLPTRVEIEESCTFEVNLPQSTLTLSVGPLFDTALSGPTNISERVLVALICRGIASLANSVLDDDQLEQLEVQIVENNDMRHLHAFQARKFLDFVVFSI